MAYYVPENIINNIGDVRYRLASETSKKIFKDEVRLISEQIGIPFHEAFPRWICRDIIGMSDEGKIDEAVSIGGKGDYGIDIFRVDDEMYSGERSVHIIQVKFSENLNHMITREELESFASTLNHIKRCPKEANRVFRQKSAELQKIESQYPNIRKQMIFAVTGKPGPQVNELLHDEGWKHEKFGYNPNILFEVLDLDMILSYMVSQPTPEIKIRFDGQIIERTDGCTGRNPCLGTLTPHSL